MSASDAMTDLRMAEHRLKESIRGSIARGETAAQMFVLDEALEHVEDAITKVKEYLDQ